MKKLDLIYWQKHIANVLYDKLRIIDPWIVLAGGAPRNWYLGEPAKDLDFFIYSHVHAGQENIDRFKKLGVSILQKDNFKDANYLTNTDIINVYNGGHTHTVMVDVDEREHVYLPFQIIFMSDVFHSSIQYMFSMSICEITWHDDTFFPTKMFKRSIDEKTVWYGNDIEYTFFLQKMKDYYPGYTFLNGYDSFKENDNLQ